MKNDLDTVAEGGENEATLSPHSLPRKHPANLFTAEASQPNAIESQLNQSNTIEFQSNLKIGVIFDWDSIAFDNRISTVRLCSILFDWFDHRIRSIEIVWLLCRLIVQSSYKLKLYLAKDSFRKGKHF